MLSQCHATCGSPCLCNVGLLPSSSPQCVVVLTWDQGTVAGEGGASSPAPTTARRQVRGAGDTDWPPPDHDIVTRTKKQSL